MSRRSRQQSPNRSPLAVIVTIILLAGAALLGQITGIDFIGMVTGEPSTVATPIPDVVGGPSNAERLTVSKGFGAAKGFWEIYFNDPASIGSDRSTYVDGIEVPIVRTINQVQSTLDIVAFEWNNPALTEAVLAAAQRGVQVRMVADNEHTIDDLDSTIEQLERAGIPIVYDQRSGLMHNKFMILDGAAVWMGSMNYTQNDIYRNNNHIMLLRSRPAVDAFQAEFNEMYVQREFGSSRSIDDGVSYTQNGTPVQVFFSPDGEAVPAILAQIEGAQRSVRFMAFSFTLDEIGAALIEKSRDGVRVEGIFELIGSNTESSEQNRLRCAGLDVRIDGNPYRLHHKVFIIDEETVIFGSFNFSASAVSNNDENMVIITDRDLAALFTQEYQRLRSRATTSQEPCR